MRKELCRGIYQNIQKQGKLPQNLAKYKNNLKRRGGSDGQIENKIRKRTAIVISVKT